MSIWSHISKLLESLVIGETLSALFNRLRTPPEKRVGFTIAAIALSAKMAKADGLVTHQEKVAFKKIFTILPEDENHVQYVFQLAQKDIAGFEIYAKKISKMLKNNPKLLENLIEGLLYISIADKIFHPKEEKFIDKVAKIFKIPNKKLEILKARYIPAFQNNPYLVLGLNADSEFKEIKKQWQRLVHESHPDNMIALGLPQEAINLATSRLIAINEAWKKINQNATNL
jgi:DnaJ like chaperone protein